MSENKVVMFDSDEAARPITVSWIACADCRAKHDDERWAKRKRQEWDGVSPLFSDAFDEWLWEESDVLDLMEEKGCTFDELKPLTAVERHVSLLDVDQWSDDIPEDVEPPDELIAAIDEFNARVKGVRMCWYPTETVATWAGASEALAEHLAVEDET